jgi:hypothetical protein
VPARSRAAPMPANPMGVVRSSLVMS